MGLWLSILERYPKDQDWKNVQGNSDKGREEEPIQEWVVDLATTIATGAQSGWGLSGTVEVSGSFIHWFPWLIGHRCSRGETLLPFRFVFVQQRLSRLPEGSLQPSAAEKEGILCSGARTSGHTCCGKQQHIPAGLPERMWDQRKQCPHISSSLTAAEQFCEKVLFPHSPHLWNLLVMLRFRRFSTFFGSLCSGERWTGPLGSG